MLIVRFLSSVFALLGFVYGGILEMGSIPVLRTGGSWVFPGPLFFE